MPAQQPPLVRAATILIVVSAVFTIVEAVSMLQNVGSPETVAALNKALSTGWAKSSHINITTLQDMLRVAANLSAVLAAAAGVLAISARGGSRQSRIGLAVLALPILIVCLMAGGYAGAGVLVGIGLLWSRNARPWFATAASASSPSPSQPTALVTAPTLPEGIPTPPVHAASLRQAQDSARLPTTRPQRVTVAAVVAIVLSSLSVVGGLLGGVGLAVLRGHPDLRQTVVDRARDQHLTLSLNDLDRYLTAATVAAVAVAVLGLLGVLAGAFTLRGSGWARVALIVLSVICALVSLVAITSIVSLIWLVGSIVVIVVLAGGDSVAWFKQR